MINALILNDQQLYFKEMIYKKYMYYNKKKVNSLYFKKKKKKKYIYIILIFFLLFLFAFFNISLKKNSREKNINFIEQHRSTIIVPIKPKERLVPPKPKEKWKYIKKLKNL